MPAPKNTKKYNEWKEKISYAGIHIWLKTNFGKANKCENKQCKIKSPKRYEWALIHGQKHARKRENYKMLCTNCHKHYDKIGKFRKRNKLGQYV